MIEAHIKEFSKHAHTYDSSTPIQKEVAKYLVSRIEATHPSTIVDLGCGSGEIYRNIAFECDHFIGIDHSEAMCALHPKNEKVHLICSNFESPTLWQRFEQPIDLLISSSALQWAQNLEMLFERIHLTCKEMAIAIFTDKTFETIYAMTHLPSFLPSAQSLIPLLQKHFTCQFELKTYRLPVTDTLSAFRYIKKSGVSGGQKRLSVSQTRFLIEHYPLSYLEFEVLFVWGKPL